MYSYKKYKLIIFYDVYRVPNCDLLDKIYVSSQRNNEVNLVHTTGIQADQDD